MSDIDEVDLPVLMSMVKDKLENPDRAWFLEVKLNAREWERLVKVWISQNEDDLQSMIMIAEDKAKKQGALETQSRELVFLNKLQERLNGYHCGYHEQLNKMINNRKEELEGCEKQNEYD